MVHKLQSSMISILVICGFGWKVSAAGAGQYPGTGSFYWRILDTLNSGSTCVNLDSDMSAGGEHYTGGRGRVDQKLKTEGVE